MNKYENIIKKSIMYVEENLHEPLKLENIAKQVSFSKFHFHRIFQSLIGMTVIEYIRMRRLANASAALLYTSERMNVSLTLHYTTNLNHKNLLREHLKSYTSYRLVNTVG